LERQDEKLAGKAMLPATSSSGIEMKILEDEAERLPTPAIALRFGQDGNLGVAPAHRAGTRAQEPGDQMKQRALA
jgi:hypothetical protein